MRFLATAVIILALAAAGYLVWTRVANGADTPVFRTAEIKRADIVSAINATGTVEPEEVVDVGAQVAGMILSFGKDKDGKTIDYGSEVDEGMVLAQIDDSLYAADAASARAQLEAAQASATRAEADVGQLKAKLAQAEADWNRAQRLGPSELLAQSAYDAYKAGYEAAKANVSVGEASVVQARAGIPLAQATVQRAERNLSYTVIKSPVKGVIVDRRVNIGQTVVSSLNAPSLFLIAKDLKRVQVWAAVNEADISHIHAGQGATFTVDALAGRVFKAEVLKVRLNASMTQNVVTYVVEVTADNSDGLLLPYLTANVNFIVDQRSNVLAVPNAALRWQPPAERIEPGAASATPGTKGAEGKGEGKGDRKGPPGATRGAAATNGEGVTGRARGGTLWVPVGKYVRPIHVTAGLSDGVVTEVEGSDVTEGMSVAIGENRPEEASAPSGGTNPFAPQIMRGRGGGGPGPGGGGAGAGKR